MEIRNMDEWRIAARALQEARDAVGREIAKARIAGASDDVIRALDAAMVAIQFPAMPTGQGDAQ